MDVVCQRKRIPQDIAVFWDNLSSVMSMFSCTVRFAREWTNRRKIIRTTRSFPQLEVLGTV